MSVIISNTSPVPIGPNNRPVINEEQFRRLEEIVHNAMMNRQNLFQQLVDPRRDINQECGYPQGPPDAQFYQLLYDTHSTANRVVQILPKETWQVQPDLYEDDDEEVVTEFEKAWVDLGKSLTKTLPGNSSESKGYYEDDQCSALWPYLLQADIISGIGHYGVILLGIDDGIDLALPASPGKRKLLYLRCFSEASAAITQLETDPNNPRFGQPVMYLITFNDPSAMSGADSVMGATTATKSVHWSRVIHIADTHSNAGSSEVYATPRMYPVLTHLLDLFKVYGGDAEGFWKSAVVRIFFETHPQLGGDVSIDTSALKDMMEQMENGLQRWAALSGMAAKTVAPSVVDPTSHINVNIQAICIQINVPQRIFMGSEAGQLASGQDTGDWNKELINRQRNYVTTKIIVPFHERLIWLGVLPKPKKGFRVKWPPLTAQTEQDKANLAMAITNALVTYVSGGLEALITPHDYLINICKFDRKQAESMLENAQEKADEEAQLAAEQQGDMSQQGVVDENGMPVQPAPGMQNGQLQEVQA